MVPPDKYRDYGLLILRIGIGSMFIMIHGLPKVAGGVQMWTALGGAFNRLIGIALLPTFFGFMAMLSEFIGGICLVAGVLFRPACALMLFTMVVAVTSILRGGYGLPAASQPFELGVVLLGLIFTGSGRFTLGYLLRASKRKINVLNNMIR